MTGQDLLNLICGSNTILGLADKSASDTVYRASALGWLNLILKDIQNRQQNFHWRWLEKTATAPTVSGQHTYDLPSDIDTNKIFALYDRTNDLTFTFKNYDEFVKLIADPSNDNGNAYIWTFWANTIRLWPIPNSVYTFYLDYIKLVTEATDNATALDIPAKYDQVLVDGLLVYVYKVDPHLGDWMKQQVAYEAGIQRMIIDNNTMINDMPVTKSHRARLSNIVNEKRGYFPVDID